MKNVRLSSGTGVRISTWARWAMSCRGGIRTPVDVLDSELGQAVAQAVPVQAQLAGSERGPVGGLLLDPGLRRGQCLLDTGPGHDGNTVVVSHHHIAGMNGLAAEGDRDIHRSGG